MVRRCPECARDATHNQEPLIPTALPQYPWQRVGSDLFVLNGTNYLLVVDYFSRFPEIVRLRETTSSAVIKALRKLFARYGVPETVVSDNGPQYSSHEFTDVTGSPHHPRSSGQAERTVKTVKSLLKSSPDPHLSLLSYRSTPLPWCNLSPAELLMGRKIRTDLPQTSETLTPLWPYLDQFREVNKAFKEKQKKDFDRRHQVRELPELPDNIEVWITTHGRPVSGTVLNPAPEPRSYIVQAPSGNIRRNHSHLNIVPGPETSTAQPDQSRDPIQTRSRTGATVNPPDRL